MGRPAPKIIIQTVDDEGRKFTIMDPTAIYAVCYMGKPIAVCEIRPSGHPVYTKTIFPHPAYARRLAAKLNAIFDTTEFSVRCIDVQ